MQEIIKLEKPTLVLDIFCGIGGFALFASQFTKKVVGVEVSESAIKSAKLAAQDNGFKNIQFLPKDAEEFLTTYSGNRPDMLICNPPRRGLSNQIIEKINNLAPSSLIYSSCNPETLANDIQLLKENYQVRSLAPFDMFPLTNHLEVLAHLRLKEL